MLWRIIYDAMALFWETFPVRTTPSSIQPVRKE